MKKADKKLILVERLRLAKQRYVDLRNLDHDLQISGMDEDFRKYAFLMRLMGDNAFIPGYVGNELRGLKMQSEYMEIKGDSLAEKVGEKIIRRHQQGLCPV